MAIIENTQFGRVKGFRFWCQKVLPAVYDDSLSYYELLCKFTHWLEELTELTNTQSDAITELQTTLQEFMEGTFDPYIEEKVDEWFQENQPGIVNDISALQASMTALQSHMDNLNFSILNFENVMPYMRDTVEIAGTVFSPQGGCSFTNVLDDIITCVFLAPSNSANNGFLRSYRNNTKVSEISVNLGHGNSMCYYDGYIYIPDNSNQFKIYRFPVSDTGVIGARETVCPSPTGQICCTPDGRFFMVNYNFIKEIDLTDGTIISQINNPQFHVLDNPLKTTTQAVGCFVFNDNIYFAYATARPNLVSIVNENGEFVCQKSMPMYAQYISLSEVENITIDSATGNFYIQSPDNAEANYQTRTIVAYKGNIFDLQPIAGELDRHGDYQITAQLVQDTDYIFPMKDSEGEVGTANPIKVYYAQDLQTILVETKTNSIAIDINGDNIWKNGIVMGSGFIEIWDNGYKCWTSEFRACQVMLIGNTILNDTTTNNPNEVNIRLLNNAQLVTWNKWTNANAFYSNRGIIICDETLDDSVVPGVRINYHYNN